MVWFSITCLPCSLGMILSNPVVVVGVSCRAAFIPCVRDHVPVVDNNHVSSSFLPRGNSDAQWKRRENLVRSQDRPDPEGAGRAQGGAGESCPKMVASGPARKSPFLLPKSLSLTVPDVSTGPCIFEISGGRAQRTGCATCCHLAKSNWLLFICYNSRCGLAANCVMHH